MAEMKNAMQGQQEKDKLVAELQDIAEYLGEEMQGLEDLVTQLPKEAADIIKTLEEMQKDSVPADGDYHKKKDTIDEQLVEMNKVKYELEGLTKTFDKKDQKIKLLMEIFTFKNPETEELKNTVEQLNAHKKELIEMLEQANTAKEQINVTRLELNECSLPAHIKLRQTEIDHLAAELEAYSIKFDACYQNAESHGTNLEEFKSMELKLQDVFHDLQDL